MVSSVWTSSVRSDSVCVYLDCSTIFNTFNFYIVFAHTTQKVYYFCSKGRMYQTHTLDLQQVGIYWKSLIF